MRTRVLLLISVFFVFLTTSSCKTMQNTTVEDNHECFIDKFVDYNDYATCHEFYLSNFRDFQPKQSKVLRKKLRNYEIEMKKVTEK